MNTTTRIRTAERLGRTLGRGWRAYVRGERRASSWLVSKGGGGGRCHRARVGGQAGCARGAAVHHLLAGGVATAGRCGGMDGWQFG
ncbi:DUF3742 family protein [Pseudomonas aeruginosa]|uniref:DUF3742 family protein n=1 Tax=Pseudomonas aeruginosa TaxID=287 RepID=UPI003D27A8DA